MDRPLQHPLHYTPALVEAKSGGCFAATQQKGFTRRDSNAALSTAGMTAKRDFY